jgi:hypothetical protein
VNNSEASEPATPGAAVVFTHTDLDKPVLGLDRHPPAGSLFKDFFVPNNKS